MSLFRDLLNAVQGWRQRRSAARSRKRANLRLECLDHRRLLSVTFTGNATADIPDDGSPGTAIIQNPNRIVIPDPTLAQLIKVSGFDVSSIRLKYTPEDDVLNVALGQPGNQKTIPEFPVIAGDADNNLDGATVSDAVLQVQPLFKDFGFLGESETMAIFLDLNGDMIPDVVAGISNDPGASKLYQVADAVVNPDPIIAANSAPGFGTPLQHNTGFAFLQNADPTQGAFEFKIIRFSELYKSKTGMDLRANTVINVGGFSGSFDDFVPEQFIPAQPVSFGVDPISDCPPLSPPIVINPHQHRHVNIAHANLVRVTVFGTSGFDVTRILSNTVEFGGAGPLFHFTRKVNRDEFLDVTYVFRGDQLDLPPGKQFASITGLYADAATSKNVPFESAKIIFVRDASSFSAAEIAAQQRRLARRDPLATVPGFVQHRARAGRVDLVLDQLGAAVTPLPATPKSTVRIATRAAAAASRSESNATPIPSGPVALRRQAASNRAIRNATNDTPASVRLPLGVNKNGMPVGWKTVSRLGQFEADLDDLAHSIASAH